MRVGLRHAMQVDAVVGFFTATREFLFQAALKRRERRRRRTLDRRRRWRCAP